MDVPYNVVVQKKNTVLRDVLCVMRSSRMEDCMLMQLFFESSLSPLFLVLLVDIVIIQSNVRFLELESPVITRVPNDTEH